MAAPAKSKAAARLQKELQNVTKDETIKKWIPEVEIDNGSDLFCWKVKLEGPENSPYAGRLFEVKLLFPEGYPFKQPDVIFITKTYHPTVSQKDGSICPEVLGKLWSPQIKVEQALAIVREMMANPGVESPLEAEVAEQFVKNRDAYNKTAKEWTEKYALKKKK
eukprot:TRINITY_DN180_c1_g1_i1.p1 TRINITY_DN180_c1_g1~~TRINITY_DN180_c1_g1_i1.p1  ORF type:complete len:164 (-),score=43.50 TRINITY_DN180_c1_g1_i1:81-572(-)